MSSAQIWEQIIQQIAQLQQSLQAYQSVHNLLKRYKSSLVGENDNGFV